MAIKIIIFDLDDTLINSKIKVPRQTYHMLNKLKKMNCIIGIISYNCLAKFVVNKVGLYKYTNYIYNGDLDRNKLFERCIFNITLNENIKNYEVYYIDDRLDNLQIVKENFPNTIIYHCKNLYELHLFKKII